MTRRDTITSITPVPLDGMCVVIPAFNEEQLVSRCVASVLAAGLAPRQVFVIDDCSTDRTRDVLATFDGIEVIENPTRLGKVGGLQRALDLYQLPERFDFIALLDADSHVDEMYFDTIVRAFAADPEATLVCGSPRSERRNWLTAYRAFDYDVSSWMYKDAQDALSVIAVAPGCASVYRSRSSAASTGAAARSSRTWTSRFRSTAAVSAACGMRGRRSRTRRTRSVCATTSVKSRGGTAAPGR